MSYQASWERSGVCLRFAGDITDVEIAMASRKGQGDPRFEDLRYVILDFRECDSVSHSVAQTEELAATDKAASMTNPRIKIAVVSKSVDVTEMVRCYLGTGLDPFPVRVFDGLEAARYWACG